jgi:hypothetical protein
VSRTAESFDRERVMGHASSIRLRHRVIRARLCSSSSLVEALCFRLRRIVSELNSTRRCHLVEFDGSAIWLYLRSAEGYSGRRAVDGPAKPDATRPRTRATLSRKPGGRRPQNSTIGQAVTAIARRRVTAHDGSQAPQGPRPAPARDAQQQALSQERLGEAAGPSIPPRIRTVPEWNHDDGVLAGMGLATVASHAETAGGRGCSCRRG